MSNSFQHTERKGLCDFVLRVTRITRDTQSSDDEEEGAVVLSIEDYRQTLRMTIPPNIWASLVLSISAFGERPGDWQAFMAHHQGKKDMLEGQRGGY